MSWSPVSTSVGIDQNAMTGRESGRVMIVALAVDEPSAERRRPYRGRAAEVGFAGAREQHQSRKHLVKHVVKDGKTAIADADDPRPPPRTGLSAHRRPGR